MSTKKKNPRWWQLYVMMPVLVALFWPEIHAALTETEHVIAELGILALIFGFTHVWLRANRSALVGSDPTEYGWGVKVYRFPSPGPFATLEDEDCDGGTRNLRTPPSSIGGVRADTLEPNISENDPRAFPSTGHLASES